LREGIRQQDRQTDKQLRQIPNLLLYFSFIPLNSYPLSPLPLIPLPLLIFIHPIKVRVSLKTIILLLLLFILQEGRTGWEM
jgi:hypothetical protein